mgnify:CR=1 FL=1
MKVQIKDYSESDSKKAQTNMHHYMSYFTPSGYNLNEQYSISLPVNSNSCQTQAANQEIFQRNISLQSQRFVALQSQPNSFQLCGETNFRFGSQQQQQQAFNAFQHQQAFNTFQLQDETNLQFSSHQQQAFNVHHPHLLSMPRIEEIFDSTISDSTMTCHG